MGFFDERVLAALKDGKPRGFATLLGEVGFSHNTLQQHLEPLTTKSLVVRDKVIANGFRRPKFAYHIPSRTTKQVTATLENPAAELVQSLSVALGIFADLKRAATAKKQEKAARLKTAPKPENKNYDHFTQLRDKPARKNPKALRSEDYKNVK
jgi:predicted ArsR family transcriptional regulator